MNTSYNLLIKNLHSFIRKYYLNSLIRGGLYTIAITLSFFLLFVFLEYFFFLGKTFKITLLSFYFLFTSVTLSIFIIIPLLRLSGLLPQLSIESAAIIIGNHFPDIKDKLLNTVQLFKAKQFVSESTLGLLNASIEQKALKMGVFDFHKAVNFKVNKKYLKYALPPVAVVVVLLLSAPSIIIKPTERLLLYDSTFVPQAPFEFILLNKTLTVEENSSFNIKAYLKGETIPQDLVLNIDGFDYMMQKDSKIDYHFLIKNVTKSSTFYFMADDYRSKEYKLNMFNAPKVSGIIIKTVYPKYIHRNNETLKNLSDLIIPEGTKLNFRILTKNVTRFQLFNNESNEVKLNPTSQGAYVYSTGKIVQSINYNFVATNNFVKAFDTLTYNVHIVKDEYPRIMAEEFQDSIFEKRRYFKGIIKDDYGFSKLFFEARYKSSTGIDTFLVREIPIVKSMQSQEFFYYMDIKAIPYLPGSEISYSFNIYDNDGINGPKMSKTQKFIYLTKTKKEEAQDYSTQEESIQRAMSSNIQKANEINKKINKLADKLKGKKSLSWQEKKEIKDVLEQYKELQKKLEKVKKNRDINEIKNKENQKIDEELLKKQEELNKLMEEVMTPEMKELMEQLKKMMEENTKKEDVDKAMEQLKMDSEFLKDQLERDLEIMKQLKFDQKFQQAIDKLDELQKRQEELSKLSEQKRGKSENLKKQQDSLNAEFDDFKKMMDAARKANEELEEPNSLKDTKPTENEISKDLEESSSSLEKGKNNSASGQQKAASSKMKSLKEQMEQMQSAMESQSNAEDMENLKNIMENLIEISFNQENLMKQVQSTSNRDPKFPEYVEAQKRISQDLSMVEDSLLKLAKRNPSISPYINKEIQKITNYSERTFLELKELNTIAPTARGVMRKSSGNQQYVMTSVNNLALMLSEVLEQMKQQQMQKSGKGKCSKPKPGSGKGMKSMRQMQEALKKQMEKMKSQMQKQGKQQGSKGSKGKQKNDGEKMSEEFAKMAAQQELIRKRLQDYKDKLAKQGGGKEAGLLDKIAKEMEQNETDLVNKIITSESILRQNEILTRLLESEKAEQEREQKEERESKEGKNQKNSNKNLLFQYKGKHSEDIELLKSIPPELRPFYKNMVDSYFSK